MSFPKSELSAIFFLHPFTGFNWFLVIVFAVRCCSNCMLYGCHLFLWEICWMLLCITRVLRIGVWKSYSDFASVASTALDIPLSMAVLGHLLLSWSLTLSVFWNFSISFATVPWVMVVSVSCLALNVFTTCATYAWTGQQSDFVPIFFTHLQKQRKSEKWKCLIHSICMDTYEPPCTFVSNIIVIPSNLTHI